MIKLFVVMALVMFAMLFMTFLHNVDIGVNMMRVESWYGDKIYDVAINGMGNLKLITAEEAYSYGINGLRISALLLTAGGLCMGYLIGRDS